MDVEHRIEGKGRNFPAEDFSLLSHPPACLGTDLLLPKPSLSLWLPVASGVRNTNIKTTILGKTAVPLAVPGLQQQPMPGEALMTGQ